MLKQKQTRMYISTISTTLIVLFIISLAFPLFMYAFAIKSAGKTAGMSSSKIQKIQILVFGFFILWWGFTSFLSVKGLLYGNVLPPKPVLFLVLPLILFLFFVVKRNATFKRLFEAIKIETLINIHIYRLIGCWFLIMAHYELLPFGFAARAGWGDILSGVLALLVTFMVFNKKTLSIKWAYAWNIFGLIDILSVVISATILTSSAHSNPTNANDIMELTRFPFALIPAFAPASLVFLHIITFEKLKLTKEQGITKN